MNINNSDIESCISIGSCWVVDPAETFGPSYLTTPLYGVVFPVLTLLTTIANTLIIHILLKPSMRSATNTILAAIAFFDLASLLSQAPLHFYIFSLGQRSLGFLDSNVCYMIELLTQLIPYLCHTTANWLTLGLSAQRYIFICKPYLTKRWCTVRRSLTGIIVALSIATFHVSTRIWDREYRTYHSETRPVCVVKLKQWVEYITPDVYFNIFFWFRVVFVQCLPCILVTVFNGFLLNALQKARRIQSGLLSTNSRVKRTCRTTFMLIILNVVFLIVEIPLSVLIMLHAISSSVHDFLDYEMANIMVLICTFCIILSYPINFAIYCSLSSQFLSAFKLLVSESVAGVVGTRLGTYRRCNSHQTQTQDTNM